MKTAKEILIEAFHAGRRFGNGTFPIQTFDEWYESNDIEAKVKNLAQPDVSGSLPSRAEIEKASLEYWRKNHYPKGESCGEKEFIAGAEWALGNDR